MCDSYLGVTLINDLHQVQAPLREGLGGRVGLQGGLDGDGGGGERLAGGSYSRLDFALASLLVSLLDQ